MMFDERRIIEFLNFAKAGDVNSILGLSPEIDANSFLEQNPEFQKDNFKWERLVALYFAQEITGQESLSGIIYSFAEFDIFRYDDDGYVLADLNIDIAAIKSSQIFGLYEPREALESWKKLVDGNKLQVQCRFHELAGLMEPSIRSKLRELME